MGYLDNNGVAYLYSKIKEYIAVQKPYSIAVGNGEPYSVWKGTYAEYCAITPDESTIYIITTPPYDAEIEYLQSTGSEYIDTGIVPSSDIRLTIDGLYPSISGSNLIHGAMSSSGSTYYRFHIGVNGSKFMGGIGTSNGEIKSADTSRHTFILTGSAQQAYVDSYYYKGTSSFPSVSIYLFARNTNGTAGNMHVFRMYSSEIYSYSQDKKLLDLIPVRKGTVGYLYDKISGTLFGTPTGSFILGADKD